MTVPIVRREKRDHPIEPYLGSLRGSLNSIVAGLAYLGTLVRLLIEAFTSPGVRSEGSMTIWQATLRKLDWLLGVGLPVVGLIHVGMGSYLAMQAYFGATFDVGVGPVVGVGLIRNGSPLLTGFFLAGLLAARETVEIRTKRRAELDADPDWVPDRDDDRGDQLDERSGPSTARLLLPRLLASAGVGPVLAAWGSFVAMFVGSQVADRVLGVPVGVFLGEFADKLLLRDVLGLMVKGIAFGSIAALVSCHEGGRRDRSSVPVAAARAVTIAIVIILGTNLTWFYFGYLAGSPFGPTVLSH